MDSNEPLRSLSRRQEKQLLETAASAVRAEFDCPNRQGCPDQRTLRLLAIRDPAVETAPDLIDHIATCCPCFLDYSRYRSRHKLTMRLCYALPSILLAVGLTVWSFGNWSRSTVNQDATRIRTSQVEISMTLDLRRMSVPRGDSGDATKDSRPRLKRARLSLTIQLPVGSEDGSYTVAVVDQAGTVLRESSGSATLDRFIEVLPVRLDLTNIPAGAYILRLRRGQTSWNNFGILIE